MTANFNATEREEEILALQAAVERLTAERDEWKHKWMALAQASLLAGTMYLAAGE